MTNKTNNIPAIDISLSGKHLIEASAGTGKTWTLTGIVLRLLIEKKTAPENIICTTFTRAAAAEMRQRIHERLTDFYKVLQWLSRISNNSCNLEWLYLPIDTKLNKEDISTFKETRENQLVELAYGDMADLIEDKVNLYLVSYLLDNVSSYPLAEALRRTTNLMTTLDKLFVSTLDSLAQKWLSEYSTETGFRKGVTISTEETSLIDSIIHDELRRYQSEMYNNNPALYKLLSAGNTLNSIDSYKSAVRMSLTFMTVDIDEVIVTDFNIEKYQQFIAHLTQHDFTDITPYLDADFCSKIRMSLKSVVYKSIQTIPIIVDSIVKHGIGFSEYTKKELIKLYDALITLQSKGTGFNKGGEQEAENLLSLNSIKLLMSLAESNQKLDDFLEQTRKQLGRNIVLKVRQQLPVLLDSRNETTFSLQMVKLNQALSGAQGDKLAKYIRHNSPIALIDESQDINGEQADVIRKVYLQNNGSHGFLLLVGDPKQAIYGFRGGDVANYNEIKTEFGKNIHSLNVNFRSSTGLINSLNHWFGCPNSDSMKLSTTPFSQLGEGIHYQHITAMKQESQLVWNTESSFDAPNSQMSFINIQKSLDAAKIDEELPTDTSQVIAEHIATILRGGHTLKDNPIIPSDIAILGRTHGQLNDAQKALIKLGIASVKTADKSVFSTQMATDLLALLEVVLRPFHTSYVNRALTTSWYNLSLAQVKSMQLDGESDVNNDHLTSPLVDYLKSNRKKTNLDGVTFNDFQQSFKSASDIWSHQGVLSAIEYLLGNTNLAAKKLGISVWEWIASQENAQRNLIDLRQLLDILSQFTSEMGEHECIKWLQEQILTNSSDTWAIQQPIPTDSGVSLMTIHKSKGLEFPIVYVLGAEDAYKEVKKDNYLLYKPTLNDDINDDHECVQKNKIAMDRRLSVTHTDAVISVVNEDQMAELKRLFYVAYTRASEQLFIPLLAPTTNTKIKQRPTHFWLECDDKNYQLPERLMGVVDWQMSSSLSLNYRDMYQQKIDLDNDDVLNRFIDYPNYDSVVKQKYFSGWAKTSFTALSRNLEKSEQMIVNTEPNYEFESELDLDTISESSLQANTILFDSDKDTDSMLILDASKPLLVGANTSESDIRFSFVKGANAGSFLHKIFEIIDFKDATSWSESIDKCVIEFDLPMIYASHSLQNLRLQAMVKKNRTVTELNDQNTLEHNQLKKWIAEVLDSPLQASGVSLKDIPITQRLPELGFNMGLGDDFSVSKIGEVFSKYLKEDSDKVINLASNNARFGNIYRYLIGEIDLVYQYEGKYYVVDYKSNHLGNGFDNYDEEHMKKAMGKAGYWLQAMIYQVALHRLLSLRIPDYVGNESNYLGASEYLFIRGCATANSKDELNAKYGKISWDIPIEMVKEMDLLLGKAD